MLCEDYCLIHCCPATVEGKPWVCLIGNSKPNNSENGRLCRDGNTFRNQTKFVKAAGFRFIVVKTSQLKNQKMRLVLGNSVAMRAISPRFPSFVNENENRSKVCQTFCLLEQMAYQAFQACRFSELGSQSNTNSKSTKSSVFRIGTNQTHPLITPTRNIPF